MNKAQLIEQIALESGCSKAQAKAMLDAQAKIIPNALKELGRATIPGVGNLAVKTRNARTCRNPQTGAMVDVPAKNIVALSVEKQLREFIA